MMTTEVENGSFNNGNKIVRNYFITLAKESPKNINYDSSSSDSYDSFHLRETDYCKDTTDTLSDSSYTTEGIATVDVVEYEVASQSESEDLYSNDSSSGTDDIVLAVAAKAATVLNSSTSDFADTEESNDDFISLKKDSELTSADYWNCIKCKNKQNNPMFRYCERCYQIRKSHFPPRPPQNKSRANLGKKNSSSISKYSTNLNKNKQCSSLSDYGGRMSKSLTSTEEDTDSEDTNLTPSSRFDGKYSSNIEDVKSKSQGHISENTTPTENGINIIDSEDEDVVNSKLFKNDIKYRKKSILRDTKSSVSYFSTPIFSQNLKRKNPFQICLENNAKRIFVNNNSSLCSSLTNITNHYSSSNNSSLTAATSNNGSCTNLIEEKRDISLGLEVNNSETDLGLESINIAHSSNSLKFHKDSGISSCSGPSSSSQEYYSSQGSGEFAGGCSSSHSDELSTTILKTSTNSSNGKKNESPKILYEKTNANISDDDTVSEDLDEKFYDSIDQSQEDKLNNILNKNKINEINKDNKSNDSDLEDDNNTNGLRKHVSEFPQLTNRTNEFSPTVKRNSLTRSISSCSERYNRLITSPNNTTYRKLIKNKKSLENCELNSKDLAKSNENLKDKDKKDQSKSDTCIVCLEEPKNGVFVHTRFLHLCCCYKCAVKIWNKNKKCPICNCAVKNVLKLFVH